jgi:preprotein translocase subunit SecE
MINKIINYVKESKAELQKVVWPSKKETIKYTLLVIGVSLGVAAFFGIIDFAFSFGFEKFLELK